MGTVTNTGSDRDPVSVTFEWTSLKDSQTGIPNGLPQSLQYFVSIKDSTGSAVTNVTVSHPTNSTVITNLQPCSNLTSTLVAINDFFTSEEASNIVHTFDSS